MASNITAIKQTNLWGKAAGEGLEPQRTDLFYVDFRSALENVRAATNVALAPILPQYVRSVTFPDLRTKAEPIRRDSVPYNTPSWDEPLDAVKLVFLLDTHAEDNRSDIVQFLDTWLALTRAGRGTRQGGFYASRGWLELNANFSVDFAFNVHLYLLRGAEVSGANPVFTGDAEFQRFTAQANQFFRNTQQAGVDSDVVPPTLGDSSQTDQGAKLALHSTYVLSNAWLAAYKVSDFSYTESALALVETTFYVESVDLEYESDVVGAARLVLPT
jgi:hypothetical protein